MTLGLSVAQQNAATSRHRVVVPLIELWFDSGTLYLCQNDWNVTAGAITYTRAAISVNQIRESATSTEGMELGMNGLDPSIALLARNEPYQGRTCRLLKAYLQSDTYGLIGNPVPKFVGRMRNIVINEQNDKADATLFAEHYDVELGRASPIRYTDTDQQALFPGDLGCQYSPQNADKTVNWPSKQAQKYGNPSPSYFRFVNIH